jgi:hypothetical protein
MTSCGQRSQVKKNSAFRPYPEWAALIPLRDISIGIFYVMMGNAKRLLGSPHVYPLSGLWDEGRG